jgi:hypothetical protein
MTSGAGRAARDDEASAPYVRRRGITQSSSRITNTLAADSGAGAGQFSHWLHPRGGAPSSGMSTTAARSPAVGASAGGTVVAVVATVVAAAAAATSYCGPVATAVPRGGSPVAAALPTSCGALDECRLISTDVSDLSTLAGARAGTVGVTLRTKKYKTEHHSHSKSGAHGQSATYLKLEKPRFLFLESSGGTAVAPVVAAVALAGTPTAHRCLHGACGLLHCPPGGGRLPPWAPAPLSPPRPVATGAGDSTTQGGSPRRSPLPPPTTTMSSPESLGGEPLLLTQSIFVSLLLPAFRRQILLSCLRADRSCSCCCAVRATARARGVGGSNRAASTVTLC